MVPDGLVEWTLDTKDTSMSEHLIPKRKEHEVGRCQNVDNQRCCSRSC